ncbi:uncharacterized protein LOC131668436 [Phymastichus coffea]|uniref:uncharacterized protein LOC131668436 n=1 Tax=Phymastichus coffea TaxID=108790 RepID=UPI00273BFAB3|nr:uncharacterized protein LOC131668436 [Phymastichus coffea]
MKSNSRLKLALHFTKYSITLLCCWPPRNPSKLQHFIFELSWWLMFISSLCLLFPLINAVYIYKNNSGIMTKSICLSCAVSQCTLKTLLCRIRRTKLQKLLEEMEDFVDYPSELDRKILEKYISQCTMLHVGVVIWAYLTSISFIIGPFLNSQPFPTDAVYPFSVDNTFVRILVYCHQSLVGLQTSAAVLLDCLVAVLLWFISARFEALAISIHKYNSFDEIKIHIEHYQRLLRYTNDIKETIDLFIFATILTSAGGMLFGAIQLAVDQPLAIKVQYAVVVVTGSVGLFICSWAADTLLQLGYLIGINIFQTNWYAMERKSKLCLMYLIAQSQHPITIKANHILPALSLQFFSQFLITSFKFFTSMRIMMGIKKMKFYENPRSYYNALRLAGQMLAIWPSKIGASVTEILFHEVKWWFSFLNNTVILLTPLILGVYYFRNQSVLMTKALCELTAVSEVFINLLQFKTQNNNFQIILHEMDDFIQKANKYEELTIQKYINRYKNFQQFLGFSFISTATLFVCIPIVTSQPLPADGWYPFSLESFPVHISIYILQVIAIGAVGFGFVIDILLATILWFCAVKTELLENYVCRAKGKTDIKYCAYQHQQLISYAKRVEIAVKYVILKTNVTMLLCSICGAYQLINHEPFEVLSRFILMTIAGSFRLYASAKPADDLKENCENLARSAFVAASKQDSLSNSRLALMLAYRCQTPIVISVTGIIKSYCLEYYGFCMQRNILKKLQNDLENLGKSFFIPVLLIN